MRQMQMVGTVLMLPATVWVMGCSDGQLGRTPTDPALEAGSARASFSHDGDDGDRNDGSGSKFRLFGNARMTRDPENRKNVVLEVFNPTQADVASTGHGAFRRLRVKIWQLDHQLSFRRAFVAPHSCGGGSPRIQLLVDADGDGRVRFGVGSPDFVAHGHVAPSTEVCDASAPTESDGPSLSTLLWRFEDLTDALGRWEVTPGGAVANIPVFPFTPWDAFEAAVSAAFPNHRIVEGRLVDDFNNKPAGITYFDLVTIFDLTLGTEGQVRAERRDDRDEDDRD
jgi:hypothetical protein